LTFDSFCFRFGHVRYPICTCILLSLPVVPLTPPTFFSPDIAFISCSALQVPQSKNLKRQPSHTVPSSCFCSLELNFLPSSLPVATHAASQARGCATLVLQRSAGGRTCRYLGPYPMVDPCLLGLLPWKSHRCLELIADGRKANGRRSVYPVLPSPMSVFRLRKCC